MNQLLEIYLLMEHGKPVSAYANKAQADEDCWICNDAEKFSADPHPFWVKPIQMGFPLEI